MSKSFQNNGSVSEIKLKIDWLDDKKEHYRENGERNSNLYCSEPE